MQYLVTSNDLALLVQSVDSRTGTARDIERARLAWHQRQRDSAAALLAAQEVGSTIAALSDPEERRRLQARLALTRAEVSALFNQVEAAESALALGQSLVDADRPAWADVHWTDALIAKVRGQRERELNAYRQAGEAARRARDWPRADLALAWSHYEHSFSDPTLRWDERKLHGQRTPAVDAFLLAAEGLQASRRAPERAAAVFLQASEQAQRVGLVRHAVVCTLNAAAAWTGLGEFERTAACLDIAEAVVRRTGWPSLLGLVQIRMGALLAQRGLLIDASDLLHEAVGNLASSPGSINHANACSELAITLMRMGRVPEALEPMRQALQGYRANASTDNLALNLIHHGRLRALSSDPAAVPEARAALQEAQALVQQHGLHALQVGIHEAWAVLYRRHPQAVDEDPHGPRSPTPALAQAELALQHGTSLPGWRAPADLLVIMADEWRAAGWPDRAYELARQAVDTLREDAQLNRSWRQDPFPLRRAQLAPPVDPEGLWRPAPVLVAPSASTRPLLTPKEQAILALVARQYANKEVANALDLGAETVKWHLKKIFAKLEVGSRRRAVDRARLLGLI